MTQRSTRIRKKVKCIPETSGSIRIKEYDEKENKFPVFSEIKNRGPFKF